MMNIVSRSLLSILILLLATDWTTSRVYRYRHRKLSDGARKLLEEPEEGMHMYTPLNMPNPYMMQLMSTFSPVNTYHPLHPMNPMNLYSMINPMYQGPLGLPGVPYMDTYMVDMDQEKLDKLNSNNNLEVDKKIMEDQMRKKADDSQDELNKNLYDLTMHTLA